MSISNHLSQTQSQYAKIVTCNPAIRKVEAVGSDRSVTQVAVTSNDNAFRWPIVGETWSIYREGYDWYLGKLITPITDTDLRLEDLQPGDMILNSSNIYDSTGRPIMVKNPSSPELVSNQISISLPQNPVVGDKIYFSPDPSNHPSTIWHLLYDETVEARWIFIGGSALAVESDANQTVAFVGWQNANPSVALPGLLYSGTYEFTVGAWINNDQTGQVTVAARIGGSDSNIMGVSSYTGNIFGGSKTFQTAVVGGDIVYLRIYKQNDSNCTVAGLNLSVKPVYLISPRLEDG